jgi:hypothetical protein
VNPRRPTVLARIVMWFGVLGAPAAWVLQFLFALAVTEASCTAAGSRWGIPVETLTTIATVAAGTVALLAGAAAAATFRAVREAGSEPPGGRMRFLAAIGITVSPLFVAIIVMNGVGAVVLTRCQQG